MVQPHAVKRRHADLQSQYASTASRRRTRPRRTDPRAARRASSIPRSTVTTKSGSPAFGRVTQPRYPRKALRCRHRSRLRGGCSTRTAAGPASRPAQETTPAPRCRLVPSVTKFPAIALLLLSRVAMSFTSTAARARWTESVLSVVARTTKPARPSIPTAVTTSVTRISIIVKPAARWSDVGRCISRLLRTFERAARSA